ncbi:hypothetical protein [Actinomyces sp. W5033]|uniref:hypothetical protein n=1 Tax=Actinomyces sp. W5033 TaxID=3446479 RepID=UPI003EE17E65
MFLPALAVVLIALFLITFLPIALTRAARSTSSPSAPAALADADRYSRRSTALAVLTGLGTAVVSAAVWALAERAYMYTALQTTIADVATRAEGGELIIGTLPPMLNLGPALAPSIMGVVGLLVLVIRERRSPLVTTPTRTASLTPRHTTDYTSRPFGVIAALTLVLLVSLLVIGTLTADASGTAHTWQGTWHSGDGPVEATSTRAPWPGWVYCAPILLLTIAQLVLAATGLHDVAARGQLTSRADDVPDAELDTALRRRSADAVVGLLIISVSLPTIAAGLVMAPVAGDALGAYPVLGREFLVLGLWALTCACAALLALGAGTALMLRRPAVIRARLACPAPPEAAPAVGSEDGGQR